MGTMIRSLFPEQHFRPPKIYRIRRPHEPEPTEANLDLCLFAIIISFYVIAAVLAECIGVSRIPLVPVRCLHCTQLIRLAA